MFEDLEIGIIGLGYVGLPLAIEFGNKYNTKAYDINPIRIKDLLSFKDSTFEVSSADIRDCKHIKFTDNLQALKNCNYFIITVPTPINAANEPELAPLRKASNNISSLIKKNDVIIYESTVYPGAIEEVCVPILENGSNLEFNKDFFCGYSPERINPGDKKHRLKDIVKVTSGSTPEAAVQIDNLYKSIISAGTHLVSSIRVAEAAKVIENTQRDLNIALVNELAIIFKKMDIDTNEVLNAAATKWNFMNFKPGLVGGHCIGVDPYYLTYKSEKLGYRPEIILAGRKLNDAMPEYVFKEIINLMKRNDYEYNASNVLVMGLSFKENCPDIRNTKVYDLIKNFENLNVNVDVYDPWVDKKKAFNEYGIKLIDELKENLYEVIILAVKHDKFLKMGFKKIRKYSKKNGIIYDIKNCFPNEKTDGSL